MLRARLGAGGMGAVFRGEHVHTGAVHAVKVLPAGDPEALLRFRREAEAMARVDGHPNMLRVHASGEERGETWIAMELAEGGTLAQRLRAGPLPPREAAALVRDLALGLAHVHARGVLHRDLKPDNVLFDAAGTPKLGDYGLARVQGAQALTMTGAVLGTPLYMAPEQARGEKAAIDARTDVYGLGAVLYHALTGQPPFPGTSHIEVIEKVLCEPPRRPGQLAPDVPRWLDEACLTALAKEPADRFQGALELAAALEPPGGDGEAPAPSPSPARLTRLLAAAALTSVLAAGAMVLAARPGPPAPQPGRDGGVAPPTSAQPHGADLEAALARGDWDAARGATHDQLLRAAAERLERDDLAGAAEAARRALDRAGGSQAARAVRVIALAGLGQGSEARRALGPGPFPDGLLEARDCVELACALEELRAVDALEGRALTVDPEAMSAVVSKVHHDRRAKLLHDLVERGVTRAGGAAPGPVTRRLRAGLVAALARRDAALLGLVHSKRVDPAELVSALRALDGWTEGGELGVLATWIELWFVVERRDQVVAELRGPLPGEALSPRARDAAVALRYLASPTGLQDDEQERARAEAALARGTGEGWAPALFVELRRVLVDRTTFVAWAEPARREALARRAWEVAHVDTSREARERLAPVAVRAQLLRGRWPERDEVAALPPGHGALIDALRGLAQGRPVVAELDALVARERARPPGLRVLHDAVMTLAVAHAVAGDPGRGLALHEEQRAARDPRDVPWLHWNDGDGPRRACALVRERLWRPSLEAPFPPPEPWALAGAWLSRVDALRDALAGGRVDDARAAVREALDLSRGHGYVDVIAALVERFGQDAETVSRVIGAGGPAPSADEVCLEAEGLLVEGRWEEAAARAQQAAAAARHPASKANAAWALARCAAALDRPDAARLARDPALTGERQDLAARLATCEDALGTLRDVARRARALRARERRPVDLPREELARLLGALEALDAQGLAALPLLGARRPVLDRYLRAVLDLDCDLPAAAALAAPGSPVARAVLAAAAAEPDGPALRAAKALHAWLLLEELRRAGGAPEDVVGQVEHLADLLAQGLDDRPARLATCVRFLAHEGRDVAELQRAFEAIVSDPQPAPEDRLTVELDRAREEVADTYAWITWRAGRPEMPGSWALHLCDVPAERLTEPLLRARVRATVTLGRPVSPDDLARLDETLRDVLVAWGDADPAARLARAAARERGRPGRRWLLDALAALAVAQAARGDLAAARATLERAGAECAGVVPCFPWSQVPEAARDVDEVAAGRWRPAPMRPFAPLP